MSKLIICIYCKQIFWSELQKAFIGPWLVFMRKWVWPRVVCLPPAKDGRLVHWQFVGFLVLVAYQSCLVVPPIDILSPLVRLSAWIVVNFCFYANPVGGGRQDRWFSSTVPSQIQMVPLSAVRPFWLGCLFVCSDLFTQCRWLLPFTRV